MTESYEILVYPGPSLPKDYEPLLYSSWLRSVRYGNDHLRDVKARSYYPRYHAYIASVLNNPASIVRIAVLSDDHDVVLGYSVSRGTSLDFVYVQKEQRRQGIGTQLTPDGIDKWTDPLTPFREKT